MALPNWMMRKAAQGKFPLKPIQQVWVEEVIGNISTGFKKIFTDTNRNLLIL